MMKFSVHVLSDVLFPAIVCFSQYLEPHDHVSVKISQLLLPQSLLGLLFTYKDPYSIRILLQVLNCCLDI